MRVLLDSRMLSWNKLPEPQKNGRQPPDFVHNI